MVGFVESIATGHREAPIELQCATTDDAAELAELQARVHGSQAWTEQMWRRQLRRDQTVVWRAVDDKSGDPTVGFVALWRVLNRIEITDLVVAPDERRRGIASGMLGAVLAVAGLGGIDDIVLEVREDNEAAIALYEGFDFRVVGRRPGFYADGAAALVMRRRPGG